MSKSKGSPDTEAVAPYKPPETLSFPTGHGRPVSMSFDPRTPIGAKMLLDATLKELPPLFDLGGKAIEVSHIFSHDASKIDDATGAESEFRRTVVFDKQGNGYSCGSQGVDKAIHVIKLMIGEPPWVPPVLCEVQVSRTKKGRNWMILYPNMEQLAKRMSQPQKGA